MNADLKDTLEDAIGEWAEQQINSLPDGTWTPSLVHQMATAAEQAFDANFATQPEVKELAS